jgi:lipopolysaccharide biosynthesis glycosyltransferase
MAKSSDSVRTSRNKLIVAVGADDAFALPMAVTLYSTLANLRQAQSICIYIVDAGITEAKRRRLVEVLQRTHASLQINWLNADLKQFDGLYVASFLKPATYLRLLLPDLLPQDCDRVIYLDSDLVIEGDLGCLWNLPIDDFAGLGVPNFYSPIVGCKPASQQDENSYWYGLAPDTPYCNAGVMVMNLKRWREENIAERAMEIARRYELPESDQDAINIIVAGRWGLLNAKWNVQLSGVKVYASWLKQLSNLSESEAQKTCDDLIRHPEIMHFTWEVKPWHFLYRDASRMRFFHYVKQSGWFGQIEDDQEVMKRTWSEQQEYSPWVKELYLARQELDRLIPPREQFILVDEATWYSDVVSPWRVIPFVEKDGEYCGPPSNDQTAIAELERLRNRGPSFMVFAWPAFWWLDYYQDFHAYLRSHFNCILENDLLVVFDLRFFG